MAALALHGKLSFNLSGAAKLLSEVLEIPLDDILGKLLRRRRQVTIPSRFRVAAPKLAN